MKLIKSTLVLGLVVSGAALAQSAKEFAFLSNLQDSGITAQDLFKASRLQDSGITAQDLMKASKLQDSGITAQDLVKFSKVRNFDGFDGGNKAMFAKAYQSQGPDLSDIIKAKHATGDVDGIDHKGAFVKVYSSNQGPSMEQMRALRTLRNR